MREESMQELVVKHKRHQFLLWFDSVYFFLSFWGGKGVEGELNFEHSSTFNAYENNEKMSVDNKHH